MRMRRSARNARTQRHVRPRTPARHIFHSSTSCHTLSKALEKSMNTTERYLFTALPPRPERVEQGLQPQLLIVAAVMSTEAGLEWGRGERGAGENQALNHFHDHGGEGDGTVAVGQGWRGTLTRKQSEV